MLRRAAAFLALVPLAACGGGSSPAAPSRLIAVGGDYTLTVALTENACGAVTVLPLPTHVDHTPGAAQVQITHGGTTYAGQLSASGSFTTETRTLQDQTGSSAVRIEGRFVSSGLEASVTVDLQRTTGETCRYVVRWQGTKQGAANVIP